MADFKNYTFKNVNALFGIVELKELAKVDDAILVSSTENQFEKTVGAKGDVVRTQTSDNSCIITVKFMQTSSSIIDLTNIYNADRELGNGIFPLLISDNENGEKWVVNNAWTMKIPDDPRGVNLNVIDWIFEGDFLTKFRIP